MLPTTRCNVSLLLETFALVIPRRHRVSDGLVDSQTANIALAFLNVSCLHIVSMKPNPSYFPNRLNHITIEAQIFRNGLVLVAGVLGLWVNGIANRCFFDIIQSIAICSAILIIIHHLVDLLSNLPVQCHLFLCAELPRRLIIWIYPAIHDHCPCD